MTIEPTYYYLGAQKLPAKPVEPRDIRIYFCDKCNWCKDMTNAAGSNKCPYCTKPVRYVNMERTLLREWYYLLEKSEPVVPMTKEEFLAAKTKDCPKCGNKVRPEINDVKDMNATLDCPAIYCSYCNTSAGCHWPGQFIECLKAWEAKCAEEQVQK